MFNKILPRRFDKWSPRAKARLTGLFFLLYATIGGWGYSVSQQFFAGADAATRANNVLSNEKLFRLAIAANLVSVACFLVVALLVYDLFKPVDRTVALLAAFFGLMSCAVSAIDSLFQIAALDVLLGGQFLSAFSPAQLQALGSLLLKEYGRALDVGLVFTGFEWLTIGYLVLRSTFLPRVFGAVAVFDALCYLTYLYPPLAAALKPYVMFVPAIGGITIIFWLTIRGVNTPRWKEQADAARGPGA
jgi:hypothetical protein